MTSTRSLLCALAAISFLVLVTGCSERTPADLEIARANIDPVVFEEEFGNDAYPQPFAGTYANAVSIDSVYAVSGATSLKITVPPEGSPLGAYAGGVLTSVSKRDFTDFNALTFYARSNVNSTLNTAGFGNDNTGNSLYEAGRANIPLTPAWTFFVIPIPNPSRLIAERGLFTFAEGFEDVDYLGHQVWFDDIRFAKLDNITDPFPVMPSAIKETFIGSTVALSGTFTRFNVDGSFVVVSHMPSYFDFVSTDPNVAVVERGEVEVLSEGVATITATVTDLPVAGSVTVTGRQPPAAAAAAPTLPAANVISMFSDVYSDRPIDTWNPNWGGSTTQDDDYVVAGDNTKLYSSLNFVGILFKSQVVDISAMTHLHMDVYAPAGTNFRIKLGAFDGDDGNLLGESELSFDASSTPEFAAGDWSSLEIPLEDFALDENWNLIGQIVLSTIDARLVLVDNIYWHN